MQLSYGIVVESRGPFKSIGYVRNTPEPDGDLASRKVGPWKLGSLRATRQQRQLVLDQATDAA